MANNVFQRIYARLVELGIYKDTQSIVNYRKSKSSGFMDFTVERVPQYDETGSQKGLAFSLAHYYEQNGDLCQDPEMVVVIYPELKMAEALTFQQASPPIYQEVYPQQGKYYPALQKDLNEFLEMWLKNLIAQEHGKDWSAAND